MTIYFTEQELKWIEKEKFHWFIKKECPQEIKLLLSKKLENFKIRQVGVDNVWKFSKLYRRNVQR